MNHDNGKSIYNKNTHAWHHGIRVQSSRPQLKLTSWWSVCHYRADSGFNCTLVSFFIFRFKVRFLIKWIHTIHHTSLYPVKSQGGMESGVSGTLWSWVCAVWPGGVTWSLCRSPLAEAWEPGGDARARGEQVLASLPNAPVIQAVAHSFILWIFMLYLSSPDIALGPELKKDRPLPYGIDSLGKWIRQPKESQVLSVLSVLCISSSSLPCEVTTIINPYLQIRHWDKMRSSILPSVTS